MKKLEREPETNIPEHRVLAWFGDGYESVAPQMLKKFRENPSEAIKSFTDQQLLDMARQRLSKVIQIASGEGANEYEIYAAKSAVAGMPEKTRAILDGSNAAFARKQQIIAFAYFASARNMGAYTISGRPAPTEILWDHLEAGVVCLANTFSATIVDFTKV